MEGGAAEETTLLTGPIQGDVVTINQRSLDLMLLEVGRPPSLHLCAVCSHATFLSSPWPCHIKCGFVKGMPVVQSCRLVKGLTLSGYC